MQCFCSWHLNWFGRINARIFPPHHIVQYHAATDLYSLFSSNRDVSDPSTATVAAALVRELFLTLLAHSLVFLPRLPHVSHAKPQQ